MNWGLYTPGVLVRSVPGDFFSACIIIVATAILGYRLTEHLFKGLSMLQREVAEWKSAEDSLHQREAIGDPLRFLLRGTLSKAPDWRKISSTVLERLGKTIHASHAYLFEHHSGPNNEPFDSMRFEWTAPGYPSDLNKPRISKLTFG
ncbi:hypothetical protein [Candidatus Villigracilis affinis]|uniref:hypothetical protein n=1 Tax=Candidatus Villigracilis affinis TaxID=3140682 RepID=UPI001E11C38E|nr:hypothetical protein [Anaerolineales bacterium]